MAWRYIAERLDRAGGGQIIAENVPITGVQITDVLSGPDRLTGTIQPEVLALKDSFGQPIIDPFSTCIWAEEDGEIRGGGLLTAPTYQDDAFGIDCMGLSGYAIGQAYTLSNYWVEVDPMDMARQIWIYLQSQQFGNLGVILDPAGHAGNIGDPSSGTTIGTQLTSVEFSTTGGEDVTFQAGPYRLAWYQTDDLGKEFDSLASATPFDYRNEVSWNASGDAIVKRIRLGYQRLGGRRTDLRFQVGTNVITPPAGVFDDGYANGILMLGAGEGPAIVNALSQVDDGRLRVVKSLLDQTITSKKKAASRAAAEVLGRTGELDVTEIDCLEHEFAPAGAIEVGDDIYLESLKGWQSIGDWFRVLSKTISPESATSFSLSIARSDKMTS